jgi:hypothetical protein
LRPSFPPLTPMTSRCQRRRDGHHYRTRNDGEQRGTTVKATHPHSAPESGARSGRQGVSGGAEVVAAKATRKTGDLAGPTQLPPEGRAFIRQSPTRSALCHESCGSRKSTRPVRPITPGARQWRRPGPATVRYARRAAPLLCPAAGRPRSRHPDRGRHTARQENHDSCSVLPALLHRLARSPTESLLRCLSVGAGWGGVIWRMPSGHGCGRLCRSATGVVAGRVIIGR